MPTDPVSISFTLEFKRNLRALAKKYRSIRSDVQPLIDQLLAGELPGDHVPGASLTIAYLIVFADRNRPAGDWLRRRLSPAMVH